MGIGYQDADREMIDYDLWFLQRGVPGLRGPRRYFGEDDFIAFTGAAQTFGRFVHDPFTAQVGRLCGKPYINLGISGAGPEYFLKRPALLEIISKANIHIAQVLSGRSVSAGVLECNRSNNGVLKFLEGPCKGQEMLAEKAYSTLRKIYGEQAYDEQIEAAREKWVELYKTMLLCGKGSTYLAWVSEGNIGEVGECIEGDSPVGKFPHFVTRKMLERVAENCAGIIDCTLESMRPQVLYSDTSGEMYEAWTRQKYPNRPDNLRAFNVYYATPEHHDLVASRVIKTLIVDGRI